MKMRCFCTKPNCGEVDVSSRFKITMHKDLMVQKAHFCLEVKYNMDIVFIGPPPPLKLVILVILLKLVVCILQAHVRSRCGVASCCLGPVFCDVVFFFKTILFDEVKTGAELHRRRADGHNSCFIHSGEGLDACSQLKMPLLLRSHRFFKEVHTHLGVEAFCDVTHCLLFASYCEMVKHKRYVLHKEIGGLGPLRFALVLSHHCLKE